MLLFVSLTFHSECRWLKGRTDLVCIKILFSNVLKEFYFVYRLLSGDEQFPKLLLRKLNLIAIGGFSLDQTLNLV